ncbi:MAG: hypothetical protein KIT09_33910 [Bryobacteraceae bacterium]|nr:hypothetical protein [Bryobacteraceae bacterium]
MSYAKAALLICCFVLSAAPLAAHNCSDLQDCFNNIRAALAAAFALAGVVASIGLDFMPVIGTVKGVYEAWTGQDLVTGQKLAWWERAVGILPGVAGLAGTAAAFRHLDDIGDIARGIDRAADAARGVDRAGDAARAVDRGADALRAVDHGADFARAADRGADALRVGDRGADAARGADRASDAARSADEAIEIGKVRCFPAGIMVRLASGALRDISRIREGDRVTTAAGASRFPAVSAIRSQPVRATTRRRASLLVELTVFSDGAHHQVSATPAHLFATTDGYRPAGSLRPGVTLAAAGGRAVTVTAVSERAGAVDVFNLAVPEDRTYFIGPLELLVHNDCHEAATQASLEKMIERGTKEYERVPGQIGERMAKDGTLLDTTRHDVTREIRQTRKALNDAKAARDFDRVAALEKQLDRLTDVGRQTYPDALAREVSTGALVAMEAKTPVRYPWSVSPVFDRFNNFANDLVYQKWLRQKHLPPDVKNVLVVDLRQAYPGVGSAKGAALDKLVDGAKTELSQVFKTNDVLRREKYGEFWDEIRFVVGSGDAPALTAPWKLS